MSNLHAVSVLGHDRPGIIAETTAALADLGLNIEDSTMTLLRGHFAMMLLCAGPVSEQEVQAALATMRVSPGCVGLAAQQVGVAAQLFCVDVTGHPKARTLHGTFALCNAEVVSASRNEKAREGCMSVSDLTGEVKRGARLVVRGELPGTGEEVTIATDGFEARALQHEIDHCRGLLFLDRVAGAHAIYPRQTYL